MKILKPGYVPFDYVKINCEHCDCEFIAHKEKEVEHTYNQKDGDSYYVICPCCGKRLYISDIDKVLCDANGNNVKKKYLVPNERLVCAVEGAHLPVDDVEEETEDEPKQFERWSRSGNKDNASCYGFYGAHC